MRAFAAATLFMATTACVTVMVDDSSSTTTPDSPTTTTAPTGWVEVAPMRVARSEHPGVALDGEVVVIGGFIEEGVGRIGVTDTVEAYSPDTDTWRDLPNLPEPIHHGMAAVFAERLFALGGYSSGGDPVDSMWELVGDAWIDRPPLPGAVGAGAAVVVDDWVYVVGGSPDGGFYRYHPESNAWAELPGPAVQREHLTAASRDGEVWAIAGRWQGEIFDTIEIYNSESQTWRSGPNLNEARSGFGAVAIGERIVVAGGELFSPEAALTSVEMLDADGAAWVLIDPLPHGLHGNPLVGLGSDLLLPGGSTRARDVINDGRTYRLTGE